MCLIVGACLVGNGALITGFELVSVRVDRSTGQLTGLTETAMTTVLERTLSEVRAKVHRARMSQFLSDRLSLTDTDCVSSQLVTPVLTALGWSVESAQEVGLDFRLEELAEGAGIALFLSRAPCVLIELRSMGLEFNQARVLGELIPGASKAGFEWVLLTDGDEYDVFNAHAGLPIEHRPFDALRLSDDSMADALEFFDLFARTRMKENRLESTWHSRLIDRRVQQSFEELVASDDAFLQLLLKKTKNLSEADVRSSLARAKLALQFESFGRPEFACAADFEKRTGRAAEMSEAELRVATWLQHRSIERWAKGGANQSKCRSEQRRCRHHRRSSDDRRSGSRDRRSVRVERATERRGPGERRSEERRRDFERRMTVDRRRMRRRA